MSYIAKVLESNGICIADKHFSLVTPKDFYLYPKKETIFEGKLGELVKDNSAVAVRKLGAVYEQ